jgi:hypothetical protein
MEGHEDEVLYDASMRFISRSDMCIAVRAADLGLTSIQIYQVPNTCVLHSNLSDLVLGYNTHRHTDTHQHLSVCQCPIDNSRSPEAPDSDLRPNTSCLPV